MFEKSTLFMGQPYSINQNITIYQPTLKEIFEYGEEKYWMLVHSLTATPSDLKWFLYKYFNLYFDEVDEFDVFFMQCNRIPPEESKILLGDLDLSSLEYGVRVDNDEKILFSEKGKIIIDRAIFTIMTEYIREMHGLKKNMEVGGNEFTRKWLIEEDGRNIERNKGKKFKSALLPLVSFVINSAETNYNYKNVWDLPIYVLLDCINQIYKTKRVDHLIRGIYAGTVDPKKVSKKEMSYIREL